MALTALLRPTVDFVFKRIFGTEDNQNVLISFLNALFEDSGQALIASVEVLNPYLERDAWSDTLSALNIQAKTESGKLLEVEIRLQDRKDDIENQALAHWSALFVRQAQESVQLGKLHKSVTINILDFDYLPTDRYHSTFHLGNGEEPLFPNLMEIHFLELRKYGALPDQLKGPLMRWILFLTSGAHEELKALAVNDPAIRKALTTLERISQDTRAWQLYEERQKSGLPKDVVGVEEEGES